jgi:hypothetical protein
MIGRTLLIPIAWFFLSLYVWLILTISFKVIPRSDFGSSLFTILLICFIVLNTIYALYWSQPFSRKKTGVRVVDEAVGLYKKPGEQIMDAWVPALVAEGRRYRNAFYTGRGKEWIVIDEQGNVLRDARIAHKVRNMLRLALQTAHPGYINERTNAYTSSQKAIQGMHALLGQFEQSVEPVRGEGGEKYDDDILALKKAAEVALRFQEGMCEYWMIEAKWGNEHGGTKLKELQFEDWRWLMEQLREKVMWLRDEIETLEAGATAAKNIVRLMKKKEEVGKSSPRLTYLLEAVISQRESLAEGFEDLKVGRMRGYERGMDEDELAGWRSRLEWVKQVDSWIAQGLTGRELEKMKEKQAKGKRIRRDE